MILLTCVDKVVVNLIRKSPNLLRGALQFWFQNLVLSNKLEK